LIFHHRFGTPSKKARLCFYLLQMLSSYRAQSKSFHANSEKLAVPFSGSNYSP